LACAKILEADAYVHNLLVADARLAVVFGIEVVRQLDSLAVCAVLSHGDPGEEDDLINVAGEVYSLQLLPRILAHVPLVVLEIARGKADLDSGRGVVGVFVGGDEIEAKVGAIRLSRTSHEEEEGDKSDQGNGDKNGDQGPSLGGAAKARS